MNRSSLKQCAYPFRVFHCADWDDWQSPFPTYKHGLADFGMPELIINCQAFGGEVNLVILRLSYDHFIDPKNSRKLDVKGTAMFFHIIAKFIKESVADVLKFKQHKEGEEK